MKEKQIHEFAQKKQVYATIVQENFKPKVSEKKR